MEGVRSDSGEAGVGKTRKGGRSRRRDDPRGLGIAIHPLQTPYICTCICIPTCTKILKKENEKKK